MGQSEQLGSEGRAPPPNWWRSIPPWGRAVLVAGVLLAGLILMNGMEGLIDTLTGTNTGSSTNSQQIPFNQTFSADGEQNTESFRLGGDYRATVSVTGDCYYSFTLRTADDDRPQDRLGSFTEPGEAITSIYAVPEGRYYLHVNTGPSPACPWELKLRG